MAKQIKENKLTHQQNYNPSEKAMELLTQNGWAAITDMFRILINQAMQEERAHYLQAGEYERTENRVGYANGFKPITVKTRIGEITFSVPQA